MSEYNQELTEEEVKQLDDSFSGSDTDRAVDQQQETAEDTRPNDSNVNQSPTKPPPMASAMTNRPQQYPYSMVYPQQMMWWQQCHSLNTMIRVSRASTQCLCIMVGHHGIYHHGGHLLQ